MFKRGVTYEGMDCLKDASSHAFMEAMDKSQAEIPWASQFVYGKYTIYFGVVVVFIAALKHVWFLQRDYFYKKRPASSGWTSLVDVFVAYSRFVGYKQLSYQLSYWTSLPQSAGSTLFMFASSLYLFCFALVPHFWYRGCSGFGSPPLAVRTGVMAASLSPFVYILSGKSNMITLVTGISYEKLNVYHQYVGAAIFVMAVIHVVPFLHQDLVEGGASRLRENFRTETIYYNGIPPLILLGILVFGAKARIRKYCYEAFWHLHWVCGVGYFATLTWHVYGSLDAPDYMWAALAFWASQVIYRILVKTAFKPNSMFLKPRKALLKKLDSNTFEVTVNSTKGYKWKPGQHCYLRFVGNRIFDSHPFSVCSMHDGETEAEMKFIVVPKSGLTRVLFDQLDEFVAQEKSVFIDGPYGGSPRDPTTFERVILLSTGSGVTAVLPYLSELCNNIRNLSQSATLPIITREITFIWVVRHADDISWVKDELDRCAEIAGDYINIHIYVGGSAAEAMPEKQKLIGEKNSEEIELQFSSQSSGASNHFEIHNFKPDIRKLFIDLKYSLSRRNFVVSSGSDSMKMAVSSEVSNLQPLIFNNDFNRSSVEEIYLHTESFGW